MTDYHRLVEIGQRCGILPYYWDIWGQRHDTSAPTYRALLNAMGIAADQPTALAQQESATWRRILAPVQVIPATAQPTVIELTLPARIQPTGLAWRVAQEDGHQHDGTLQPATLERHERRVLDDEPFQRFSFRLPLSLPLGYHRLTLADAEMCLVVVPERCYQPPALENNDRLWGLAVQLYSLRSERNWGIGDFTDLAHTIDLAAALGADCIGLNPLHELFAAAPEQASPYSPSNRRFLNPLYLDVEGVAEFARCHEARERVAQTAFQSQIAGLRAADLVDYPGVAVVKFEILALLYRHFRDHEQTRDSARARDFQHFCDEHGGALQQDVLFDALNDWFRSLDPAVHGWCDWPPGFRHPDSEVVQHFATDRAEATGFHCYLQWLAADQLESACERAATQGMVIGLYRDLAVGETSHGAATWSDPTLYGDGARIGAPPDEFSPGGQDWGLPPPVPKALRERAYTPFRELLRANMRHSGALRIDHVMALLRLFWVPPGQSPRDGAYVAYPLADLLGILALESQRHRCLVIGEDLGTVPDELRTALTSAGVLSYRLLYFEKRWDTDGEFLPPTDYPAQALVAASTHDLPTLAGFWRGYDIDLREQLGLFPKSEQAASQRSERAANRARLVRALHAAGLASGQLSADSAWSTELSLAVHVYLARSPAHLLMVQPEDVWGEYQQVNLPGTTDQHPNWRRKLPLELEHWHGDERLRRLAAALHEAGRGRLSGTNDGHATQA